MHSTEADWQAVSHELAGALQRTILRNPTLTAAEWDRAHAALGQYEQANVRPSEAREEELLLEAPDS
jgi:hypothetical protein